MPGTTFNKKSGFSLVEIIAYVTILGFLLLATTTMVVNIFQSNQKSRADELVQSNARFVMNFLTSRLHSVEYVEDISPDPAQFKFHTVRDTDWFTLELDSGNLVYEQLDNGQLTNINNNVVVSNWNMAAVENAVSGDIVGVQLDFEITTGNLNRPYTYVRQNYQTSLTINK